MDVAGAVIRPYRDSDRADCFDLLPGWQGRGLGRRLIDTERAALASRGVAALHLTMVDGNVGARRFYDRLGFRFLEGGDGLTTLGISTS